MLRGAIRNPTNSADALRRLERYLPPKCRRTSTSAEERLHSIAIGTLDKRSGVKKGNLLWRDSRLLLKSRHAHEVLSEFESDLKLFVAESSPSGVFIHSGVVGWKGKAILIPGYSFSGVHPSCQHWCEAGAALLG